MSPEGNVLSGNSLTLEELQQIEEAAHRSHTGEAKTILRLSAALREAMQIRENAVAILDLRRKSMTGAHAGELNCEQQTNRALEFVNARFRDG